MKKILLIFSTFILSLISQNKIEIKEKYFLDNAPFLVIKGVTSSFSPLKIKINEYSGWIRSNREGEFEAILPLEKGENKIEFLNPEIIEEGIIWRFTEDNEKWAIHSGLRDWKVENGVISFKICSFISFLTFYNYKKKLKFPIFEIRCKNNSEYYKIFLSFQYSDKTENTFEFQISPFDEDFKTYKFNLQTQKGYDEERLIENIRLTIGPTSSGIETKKEFCIDYISFKSTEEISYKIQEIVIYSGRGIKDELEEIGKSLNILEKSCKDDIKKMLEIAKKKRMIKELYFFMESGRFKEAKDIYEKLKEL